MRWMVIGSSGNKATGDLSYDTSCRDSSCRSNRGCNSLVNLSEKVYFIDGRRA